MSIGEINQLLSLENRSIFEPVLSFLLQSCQSFDIDLITCTYSVISNINDYVRKLFENRFLLKMENQMYWQHSFITYYDISDI